MCLFFLLKKLKALFGLPNISRFFLLYVYRNSLNILDINLMLLVHIVGIYSNKAAWGNFVNDVFYLIDILNSCIIFSPYGLCFWDLRSSSHFKIIKMFPYIFFCQLYSFPFQDWAKSLCAFIYGVRQKSSPTVFK